MYLDPALTRDEVCHIIGVETDAQLEAENEWLEVDWNRLTARILAGDTSLVAEFLNEFGSHWDYWPKPEAPLLNDCDIPF